MLVQHMTSVHKSMMVKVDTYDTNSRSNPNPKHQYIQALTGYIIPGDLVAAY